MKHKQSKQTSVQFANLKLVIIKKFSTTTLKKNCSTATTKTTENTATSPQFSNKYNCYITKKLSKLVYSFKTANIPKNIMLVDNELMQI